MTTMEDAAAYEVLEELTTPRPLAEYHEDMGPVLWWAWEPETEKLHGRWKCEPPYVGTPNDLGHTAQIEARSSDGQANQMRLHVGGWPGYHTHFTPLPPMPKVPT